MARATSPTDPTPPARSGRIDLVRDAVELYLYGPTRVSVDLPMAERTRLVGDGVRKTEPLDRLYAFEPRLAYFAARWHATKSCDDVGRWVVQRVGDLQLGTPVDLGV